MMERMEPFKRSVVKLLLISLVSLSALLFVRFLPRFYVVFLPEDYAPLHLFLKSLSIIVSLAVFLTSWSHGTAGGSRRGLLLGNSFLAVGLIDIFHTLSYAGIPDFLTPSSPQ